MTREQAEAGLYQQFVEDLPYWIVFSMLTALMVYFMIETPGHHPIEWFIMLVWFVGAVIINRVF